MQIKLIKRKMIQSTNLDAFDKFNEVTPFRSCIEFSFDTGCTIIRNEFRIYIELS